MPEKTNAAGMTGKQRMALRSLLGVIVLADGRIRNAEIEEYALQVHDLTGGTFDIRNEMNWLLKRSAHIRERMTGPGARFWLEEQIAILRESDHLTNLLHALWSVAISDDDLHPTEARIIDHAFAQWMSSA